MSNKIFYSTIVPQAEQSLQQLCLNLVPPRKPQIESIPGISARERHRYRVTLNGEILGDKLTSHEALKLAGGKR